MGCGGFQCSKNALIALNSLFILFSLLLIILPAVAKAQAVIDSMSVVGGIIACGVFLFLVSLLGLIGAIRHHQVCLFFYMVILFLIFLIEFIVSIACLAVSKDRLNSVVESAWKADQQKDKMIISNIQRYYCCCQFNENDNETYTGCPYTEDGNCGTANPSEPSYCQQAAVDYAKYYLNWSGGLGLFFSFIELLGVVLTFRYRHLKDPRANPNAFL